MNNNYKEEYIQFRIKRALETFDDAKLLAENDRWTSCVNRLYYSCFYIISALLLKNDINYNLHSGLKTQFSLNFIKTGKISKEYGKLFSDLFNWRHKGDYSDLFLFDEEAVKPIIDTVEEFINEIINIING